MKKTRVLVSCLLVLTLFLAACGYKTPSGITVRQVASSFEDYFGGSFNVTTSPAEKGIRFDGEYNGALRSALLHGFADDDENVNYIVLSVEVEDADKLTNATELAALVLKLSQTPEKMTLRELNVTSALLAMVQMEKIIGGDVSGNVSMEAIREYASLFDDSSKWVGSSWTLGGMIIGTVVRITATYSGEG